ncbi:MAG: hypothetical protein ACOH12_01240 [Parvibaculaceae bacterium]
MKWFKLTERSNGKPIFVNMEQSSSFQRVAGDKFTTIWFLAGQPDGVVEVEETPNEIISKMRDIPDA